VAIPHGRCAACRDARASFLRLAAPVDFAAADGEPVDLVLAIAAPEHFSQQHLQLLSEIAERFAEASFRDALRAARDTQALQAVLAGTVAAT
jgi:PTS system nitrogen regulatory IIA component